MKTALKPVLTGLGVVSAAIIVHIAFETFLLSIVLLAISSVVIGLIWYGASLIVEDLDGSNVDGYDEIIYSIILQVQEIKERLENLEEDRDS